MISPVLTKDGEGKGGGPLGDAVVNQASQTHFCSINSEIVNMFRNKISKVKKNITDWKEANCICKKNNAF